MAKKKIPVWKVLYEDFNRKHISYVNVFEFYQFSGIFNELKKILSKFKKTWKDTNLTTMYLDHQADIQELRTTLLDTLDSRLVYAFWAKCEYEVIVSTWPPHFDYDAAVKRIKKLKAENNDWHKDVNSVASVLNVGQGPELKIDIYKQITANYASFQEVVLNYIGYNDYVADMERGYHGVT